jgi:hypothetical protein
MVLTDITRMMAVTAVTTVPEIAATVETMVETMMETTE